MAESKPDFDINLTYGHHILKSILSFNNNNYQNKLKDERFQNEFDIIYKNNCYTNIRKCFGSRVLDEVKS
jgi:hypothetical protein